MHDTDLTFSKRHIGIDGDTERELLRFLGFKDMDSFIEQVVPADILSTVDAIRHSVFATARTEKQALGELRKIAHKNKVYRSFIGQGYYHSDTPSVILRNVLENPAWYTAYTPYQAEISQGRLEALLNYQTMVADLNGMEVANASLLDEASAAAEAMALCYRICTATREQFFVDSDCFPQTVEVVRTRARHLGINVVVDDLSRFDASQCFGCLLQYPCASGTVRNYEKIIAKARGDDCRVVMATDLLALTLLKSPGSLGADVAVGCAQRFGMPMGCGGPHAAYIATSREHRRKLPGRIVGVSVDSHGNRAYCLVLQVREQHIRREKATSNICTAQTLPAVIAGFYAIYHGPHGLTCIAERIHRLCCVLAAGLQAHGFALISEHFFDTLNVDSGKHTDTIIERALRERVNLRRVDERTLGISLDEASTLEDVRLLWQIFSVLKADAGFLDAELLYAQVDSGIPPSLKRTDAILQYPVFNRYHSETQMLRYLRTLADQDLALDRAMIPLGSCTMKLNASTEMLPISWPEFADIHPFAPSEQTTGYRQLVRELEQMLCAVTGYAAGSVQPNAGSQGEYAGLLAIKAYHASRRDDKRSVCLIPVSAHGTNPATAQMCGMDIVSVRCDAQGNVDLGDLKDCLVRTGDKLAAIMITYPSTHGVFEPGVVEICRRVHEAGGLVYIDGANLNAMVGLCLPGQFGGDVSHLNLHKTFCIPHGGGGPGVGPVMVSKALSAFLPSHTSHGHLPDEHRAAVGPVAAAQWGSAGILPISWMYLKMMGPDGLKHASQIAILNANYIAMRLGEHYPVLYRGEHGWVAHECIIDLRPITETTGIRVEDVAKRLMDYGFHAPTVSFPVTGALMIEPTESEPKEEMDRFCDAMIAIRQEIAAVACGDFDAQDNPLKMAPHTAMAVGANTWEHAYTREQAAWAGGLDSRVKYWPPVGRIDYVHGDRHFLCLCSRDTP